VCLILNIVTSDENIDQRLIKEHKVAILFISFMAVLFNFLPVFNIFAPFFGEISMFHYFRNLKK
jgi:hypothetical protein